MNYGIIKKTDVANGPGVRVSLFVSGCPHCCKGCFNAETWDFSFGMPYTEDTENLILEYLDHSYISGFSLLGGEPLHPRNQKALLPLLQAIRKKFPNKTIWCYTGYEFEREIIEQMLDKQKETRPLLKCIDVLVDGRFIEEQKDLTLKFKGSANQRLINVTLSLEAKTVVLWE